MKRTVIARARVVVEVTTGPWSDTTNVDQLMTVAKREADEKIRAAFSRAKVDEIKIVSIQSGSITAVESDD